MNLLAMAVRLHREMRRSTAAPTSITGATERNLLLFDKLADAWLELQNERLWRWMRVTTDAAVTIDQQAYSGADLGLSRFGRWRTEDENYCPIMYVDGQPNTRWPLSYENLAEFRQQWIYLNNGSTQPIAWSIDEQDQFLMGPKPAAAYKLRAEYWMSPTELAADTDEPDMPSRFHMLLVWRALVDIAKGDGKPELVAMAEENHRIAHAQLLRDQGRWRYVP